ncbi:MAG: methionine--tRNA ligase [Deltaproteobacteria bacterium]|nr:methionine--tRNA ligase [Deltaproteobacteria bacterium]
MDDAFYITTPIYYVNASPHIGHAYTTIVADVLARYHRLRGCRTFFVTGTDEHGDKIVEAAQKASVTPREYADRISAQFRALWPELAITNDYFIRTTDVSHEETVRQILRKVHDAGDIYFGQYEGFYCVGCERFYMEKELVDGKCPDHQTAPEFRKESNYFFRMGKYQEWLIRHIEENPEFIRPERYRNEALAFLRDPLEDLCISRPKSRLTWGITLPFDENYVTYVWFDALINYVTAVGYPDGENFKTFWPAAQHLIAKDILKPHGIYWPTMLKAAGIEPYRRLNVHGYWNVDQSKMSKSLGNVVKPLDLRDKYGLDPFRYFLLRDMVFGLDSSFSEEAFVQRINSDLANDLGNLVSRTMQMAVKYGNGQVPEPAVVVGEDLILREAAAKTVTEVEACFETLSLHKALISIWEFINVTNKYIVEREPWVLAKDPANHARLETILYNLLEALRITAVLIAPFMPGSATKILEQLGIADPAGQNFQGIRNWGGLEAGSGLKRGEPLFPRVEIRVEEAKPEEPPKAAAPPPIKPEISYEEFEKVDLRAAKVLAAERVPKSNKLLRLTVEIDGERQIVAGMGKDYKPEDLIGKTIVVVANLKPAKLMRVESRGMLLATDTEDGLTLLGFDRPPKTGAKIR